MNFLFDNPLANLPGPAFLALYGALIASSAIVLYLFKSRLDWTSQQPAPLIPPVPDPFEIAYLRGGENEFARTVVFTLTQKGFLQITNEGKKSYIGLPPTQPNWTTLTQLERSVLKWFQTTRETSEIFEPYGLREILQPYTLIYEQKITQDHLLTPPDVKVKTRLTGYLIMALLGILGGYKILATLVHGRYNFGILILLMIGTLIVFHFLGKSKRLSERGRRYVESLQNAFEKLKDNPSIARQYYSQSLPALNTVDPLLLAMGIYGAGVLVGSGYNNFEQAFHRSQKGADGTTGSSCSSGCGSSCDSWSGSSSCSSGDGGSSCSGGSSCGGGGCGGGCGGS